jgi:glucose-6-phosphate isomerase
VVPSALALDISGCLAERAGAGGIARAEVEAALAACHGLPERLRREHAEQGRHAYLDVDRAAGDAAAVSAFAGSARRRFRRLVQLGIGGSAMGNRAVHQALPGDREVVVIDNVDPRRLAGADAAWLCDSLVHVVTKSGETAETLAQLAIVKARLEDAIGPGWREHLVLTTDPTKGALRRIAREHRITSFEVPPALGGRWSYLSAVGLLSLAFAGRDPRRLVEGARAARARGLAAGSAALVYGCLLERYHARGVRTAVFWPYADGLQALGLWWQQLLGESLGKRVDRAGRVVEAGILPVPAVGATDQHSVLQLFMEGPRTLWLTLLEVDDLGPDPVIPHAFPGTPALDYLRDKRLGELLRAERRGTTHGLVEAGRPTAVFRLPELIEETIGGLLMTLMMAVSYAGEMLAVDAYDQPGVETGKRATQALLGRSGPEAAAAIERSLTPLWVVEG